MSNAFMIPIFIAVAIIFINSVLSQKLKYEKKFQSEISNKLYALSFVKPFVWFVPEEHEEKGIKNNQLIVKAGFDHIINNRSYTTFQVLMFIVLIFTYAISLFFMDGIVDFMDIILTIKDDSASVSMSTRILVGVGLLVFTLIPKFYMMAIAKQNKFMFTQELPVIQLSIILMLRAKSPLGDILHSLGTNQTRYRHIFEKAYRIYLRDKSECWNYLEKHFVGSGFEDTISVLAANENYSREETIRVLDNVMAYLIQASNEQKKSGAALGNLFSQFSMAIPFGALLLLGAVPFAMYVFEMMGSGMSF